MKFNKRLNTLQRLINHMLEVANESTTNPPITCRVIIEMYDTDGLAQDWMVKEISLEDLVGIAGVLSHLKKIPIKVIA